MLTLYRIRSNKKNVGTLHSFKKGEEKNKVTLNQSVFGMNMIFMNFCLSSNHLILLSQNDSENVQFIFNNLKIIVFYLAKAMVMNTLPNVIKIHLINWDSFHPLFSSSLIKLSQMLHD